jgi:anthraniloyl-CoA monooxygenase
VNTLVIGGGPAGLCSAFLLKKNQPQSSVTLIDRAGITANYGWGIVCPVGELEPLRDADPVSFSEIREHLLSWGTIEIRHRGTSIRCGGHQLSGISRRVLLEILEARCLALGVDLRPNVKLSELDQLIGYDLIVGADGVTSRLRRLLDNHFGTSQYYGKTKYIWLGIDKVLDSLTLAFRAGQQGLFWMHAYPTDGDTSTSVIECSEQAWRAAGLDESNSADTVEYLTRLFAPDLGNGRFIWNNSRWLNFLLVRNKKWFHENKVLVGDAAHSTHFSIGAGTTLAIGDAVALAQAVNRREDLADALWAYELERRPIIQRLAEAARASQNYFEKVEYYLALEPLQFAFHVLTRSGRVSHDDLRRRDTTFVDAVERSLDQLSTSKAVQRSAPSSSLFRRISVRSLDIDNRCAVLLRTSPERRRYATHQSRCNSVAFADPGLLITEPVAVSPEGRINSGCAMPCSREHILELQALCDAVHQGPTKLVLQLNHAGPRASTVPRDTGLDIPLKTGGWRIYAASAIAYSNQMPIPAEIDKAHVIQVCKDFARAATLAADIGVDMLQLNFAHGYLIGSFLSPLTNARNDAYGGPLRNRIRLAVEVLAEVRSVWPADKPIAVALSVVDGEKGGTTVGDTIEIARVLKGEGCDLISVFAGQTRGNSPVFFSSQTLVSLSDEVRHGAGIATIATGFMTTVGQASTVIAAGRADICVISAPYQLHPTAPYWTFSAQNRQPTSEGGAHLAAERGAGGQPRPSCTLSIIQDGKQ